MGKLSSFKLVKKQQWTELIHKIAVQEEEIASATTFIKEIEKGNLETLSDANVELDTLAGSLVTMRNKMKVIAQEEKERNWVAEGLAKFSEILRSNNKNLDHLSNQIISELVKYVAANQGGLFLINNANKSDVHIELIACYAYNRKKYVTQRVELGEGLLGQAALEKGTIYMTDIPTDYMRITSGLGESLPRNILIVPLKLDEEVYGLVELASFQEIKPYQILFIEKLSENLAATIAAVRTSEQTQLLLKESQLQAEQLRSQEEEMRQNMEELNATQEAIARKQQETIEQSNKLNAILDSTVDAIITIDENGKIETVNKSFTHLLGYTSEEIIGKNINVIVPSPHHENHDQYLQNYLTTGNAKIIGQTRQSEARKKDGSIFQVELAVNVVDLGERKMFTGILRDVTERVKAELDKQQHIEELRAQEEEMRQNMEELSATQEEIQRILLEVQKNEKAITELINVSNDSILTLDRELKVVTFNAMFVKNLTGLDVAKGFDFMTLFVGEDKVAKKELYNKVFEGQTIEMVDHSNFNGKEMYHQVKHAPMYDVDGTINTMALYASDITELYKAKQEAEQKEKELNELLNVSTDSIITLDKDYRVLRFNQVFANSFGGLKIEKGFDIFEMFGEDKERKHKKEIYNQAFSGKVVESIDHIHIGEYDNYFRVTHSPIFDDGGNIASIAIYASDITELYKAKQGAEQKEKELNELLNVSTDSIMTLDREYKILQFNETFAKTIPMKIEKGFDLMKIFPPVEQEKKKETFNKVFEGQRIEVIDHTTITGTDMYLRVTHAPLYDVDGKINAIAIYASEITELYKAKQEAEQAQKAITELLNVSKDNILTLDRDYKVILFNKNFEKVIPMKVEKGFDFMTIFPPDERPKKKELYDKVFKGETIEMIDSSTVTGSLTYHKVIHAPLYDVDGKIHAMALYVSDVTELYNAKEEAEQKAKEAQQQAEEVRAQEEELRQNMEELQAIQEDLNRKNQEMEKVKLVERDRADAVLQSQKRNMQNVMAKFKQLEADYKKRITELEEKLDSRK